MVQASLPVPRPEEFEKLGVFYLGRGYDLEARTPKESLFLYESKHLLTHALCVGMTGSGKTGLLIGLLEEAAIDSIPAIVVDPKGDLANLLLTFPGLRAEEFHPFIDPDEAAQKGKTTDAVAADVAAFWREGLAASGQDGARIQRFRDACEVTVYTPASTAGVPLSLLGSFEAPSAAVLEDAEAFGGMVEGAASGLLALAGVEAEPRSREHVLVAQLFASAWSEGRSLDLAALVQSIQKPGFDRIGALDLETFFPAKERAALALAVNTLLASPSAAAWARGESLDVARLLRTPEGKPRIAVLSLAHLSDAQRMFFVTRLLDAVIGWMRRQSGTSSLRALLLMDEIFGYFPPVSSPPSKRPMLTLLKQARAFGLGIVLATQNPVDLDYKGLANCGTWFLGRLQAERDKLRVLDGLEGAQAAAGHGFDRATVDRWLSGLGGRVFLCNDVHAGGPVLFQSRHTLSYLRGPLTREQIASLSAARGGVSAAGGSASSALASSALAAGGPAAGAVGKGKAAEGKPGSAEGSARPAVPGDVDEVFFPPRVEGPGLVYRPGVFATLKLHYVQAKKGVDHWEHAALIAPFGAGGAEADWANATPMAPAFASAVRREPSADARFELPPAVSATKLKAWQKALAAHAYQTRPLVLYECAEASVLSRPGEPEAEFQARLVHGIREERDARLADLDKKYAPKFAALDEKIRTAEAKLQKEQADVRGQTASTAVTFGSSLLGAVFGAGVFTGANVNRATAVARQAQRTTKEKGDVARAEDALGALREKRAVLQAEANAAFQRIQQEIDVAARKLGEVRITPRKADIAVERVALGWVPFRVGAGGVLEAAW
ncbi:ATP-binding protein [Pendulispora albinea]|uniref:Helicase HerA central domain-containing protein n=1 Tax=Pendulispora albinea TaxID=2741071 RepID=A0ABZ2M1T6_9BACT